MLILSLKHTKTEGHTLTGVPAGRYEKVFKEVTTFSPDSTGIKTRTERP